MSLIDLPEDILKYVASNLDSPDLLKFLSSSKRFHEGLGKSSAFWNYMVGERDSDEGDPRNHYMIHAYRKHIPAVKWYKISRQSCRIPPREGHLACTFSDAQEERVCITGGFSDDPGVYILQINKADVPQGSRWLNLTPSGPRDFVYGASLTSLDSTRAVRFGGFQAGGYSSECNTVMLLTVEKNINDRNPTVGGLRSGWRLIQAQNPQFARPRAYHSATLLNGRYLLIVGGMTEGGCILSESLLDTNTWTWLDPSRITDGIGLDDTRPSSRHGHSVVLDDRRNRLVLFGGGSGTDLLRSGEDNAEVWELKMGDNWNTDLEASFPWTWRKIHRDPQDHASTNEQGFMDVESDTSGPLTATLLTPSETLCLGRCHSGLKISPDTALCLLGSGNPSTNGVLAYDLSRDLFLRPVVFGSLPQPRFTFACELIQQGFILVHGGFSSQDGTTLGDLHVLDLAPFVKNRAFSNLSVESNARSHRAVTNDDVQQGRMSGERLLRRMFDTLGSATVDDRQALAQEMMGQLIANGHFGGQAFMLMRMVANGSVAVRFGVDSDPSDDDGSEDHLSDDNDDESFEEF